MRVFLAIELSEPARAHAARLARVLRNRTVRAENLHVTVKFFGEVPEPTIPLIHHALRDLSAPGPLRLWADRIECFPSRGPIRVVTAGIAGDSGALALSHREIERRTEPLGFPTERREYRPHITLERCRPPLFFDYRERLGSLAAAELPGPEFPVSEFVLMESHLRREGTEYIVLARFPLVSSPGSV